jgi:hypothetical protein
MAMLDDPALDTLAKDLRDVVAKRGIRSLLLIDDQGKPHLIGWGEPAEATARAAEDDGLVQIRSYTLTLSCGPCKTSGPHAGMKKCCEQIGGDYICRWVPC